MALPTRGRGQVPTPTRRQETLRATAERVQEAQRRAQQCFLSMIEGPVDPQVFVAKARYINPHVYNDVVVERAVEGLCGYPMCRNTFTDTYGSRTYVIRSNRLYDITERRNFCSNVCYEASELVKKQVLKLPLYLRDTDDADMKDVCLPNLTKLKGRHGKLIDVTGGINNVKMDDTEKSSTSTTFMSVDDVARESLVNWSENEADLNKDSTISEDGEKECNKTDQSKSEAGKNSNNETNKGKTPVSISSKSPEHVVGDAKEGVGTHDITVMEVESSEKVIKDEAANTPSVESVHGKENNTDENSCAKDHKNCDSDKSEKETSPKLHDGAQSEGETAPLDDVHKVEVAMRQWVTFDSLRVVLGDRYLKGMLEHMGQTWDNCDTTSGLRLTVDAKARYIAICRRLEHEERLEEEGHDAHDEHPEKQPRPSKPLPDYARLQREAKKQQLKVVSFLGGSDQYEAVEEKLDPIPEGQEEGLQPTVKKTCKPEKQSRGNEEREPTLPFVDSYSQIAWRRNIVTEKVSIYLQQMLEMTRLDVHEVRKLLGPLVATFHLSPDNISFHPKQWRLVTLILLNMLSVRYPIIQETLQSEEGCSIQKTILSAYSLDIGYSERALSFLTEIQHVLSKDFKNENNSV